MLKIGVNRIWIEKTQIKRSLEFLEERVVTGGEGETGGEGGFLRRRREKRKIKELARQRESVKRQLWNRLGEVGTLFYPMLDYPDESYWKGK